MDSKKSIKRAASPLPIASKKLKLYSSDLSLPTPAQFRESALPQQFSLRMPIMKYVWYKSPEIYQKLIKCCKLFFLKNPILVLNNLCYGCSNGWRQCTTDRHNRLWCRHKHLKIDTEKYQNKTLWISETFCVHNYSEANKKSNNVYEIIPKICRYDVEKLELQNQLLSYEELIFLATGVKEGYLFWNTIKDSNDELVPLEDIIKAFSGADRIFINFSVRSDNAACKSYDDFITVCNTIKKVDLSLVPSDFDVQSFYQHLKCTKSRAIIKLLYCSDRNRRLQEIADEILSTMSFEFIPPIIEYYGQKESQKKMIKEIQEFEAAKCH